MIVPWHTLHLMVLLKDCIAHKKYHKLAQYGQIDLCIPLELAWACKSDS